MILAIVMIATVSMTAFAAETNDGSSATSITVKGNFTAAQGVGEKISVDVAWDAMEFTYTEGAKGEWLPGEHKYADDATGSWSTETATITVTNHSNVAVYATLGFTSNVDGVIGTFTEASGTANDNILALATAEGTEVSAAPSASAEFGISGAAITETEDQLGTVTVVIAESESGSSVMLNMNIVYVSVPGSAQPDVPGKVYIEYFDATSVVGSTDEVVVYSGEDNVNLSVTVPDGADSFKIYMACTTNVDPTSYFNYNSSDVVSVPTADSNVSWTLGYNAETGNMDLNTVEITSAEA